MESCTEELMKKRCTINTHDIHSSPVTSEKVTVPFSPASKSLANMLVTNDPAGRPSHICIVEMKMYSVNYIDINM